MSAELTEDYLVEQAAIEVFRGLGYFYVHGSELCPENEERESYRHVILKKRFLAAIKRINPWLTDALAEQAYKSVSDIDHPDYLIKGKLFYEMLVNGVRIKVREKDKDRTRIVSLVDFENQKGNECLAANQFTVEYQFEGSVFRRPDLVVFLNGLPLAVFEFKSFNSNETAKDAFYDHKKKIGDIPQLYVYAQVLAATDGLETKYGSVTSDWDRFFVWEGLYDDEDLEVKEISEGQRHYVLKNRKSGICFRNRRNERGSKNASQE